MLKNNEKTILRLIKYAPFILIIILFLLIANGLIINNEKRYERDIAKIEKEFLRNKKALIKDEIENLYRYIVYKKEKSEERLKKQLKQKVLEAHTIAWSIYNTNRDKDKATIFKMIKDTLRNIRFNNGRGYFFIHDIDGNNQMYPLDSTLEGKNYLNLKDINGYNFVQTIVDTIKNKTETFDTYYWSKPSDEGKRIFKKIAFYKHFEPLDISISTGEYLEDFENEVKNEILKFLNKMNSTTDKYYFIYDYKSILLAHKNSEILGKSLIELEKNQIKKIGTKFVEIAKNGDGFFMYESIYTRLDTKSKNIKTSYIKGFDEWGWGMGTGFYTNELEDMIKDRKDELNKENKQYVINTLLICLFVTLLLLFLSFYISKKLENKFLRYRNKIFKEMEKNRKKDTLLAQQSKMAAMGEMIGNIAHQWRQPLSLISTAASGVKMQKEFGILEDEHLIDSLDSITNATKHLSKTIDDFKNFFQPNKEKTLFSTKDLIKKTRNLINAQFEDKRIEIIENIEDIELYTLENELIQVLINIFNNSKDEFIKKDKENRLIFIDIKEEEKSVLIVIKDNAGGINENIIDRIFEPYFTTKHKSQGTGIGLYMSEEIIVKHMNGSIEVENVEFDYNDQLQRGAQFTISLPKT